MEVVKTVAVSASGLFSHATLQRTVHRSSAVDVQTSDVTSHDVDRRSLLRAAVQFIDCANSRHAVVRYDVTHFIPGAVSRFRLSDEMKYFP